jgi:hypothetical protein
MAADFTASDESRQCISPFASPLRRPATPASIVPSLASGSFSLGGIVRRIALVLLLCLVAVPDGPAADPVPAIQGPVIPEPLRPWTAWVLDGESEKVARCPALDGVDGDGSERVCAWPATLSLSLGGRGGTFSQEWEVFKPGFVDLPGDGEHWPLDVRLNGRPVPVVDSSGTPRIELPAGHHAVTGRFVWDSLPESIGAPSQTGILALTVGDRRSDFPMRDEKGHVFLGRKAEGKPEVETVDISVHRKLVDDTPLRLVTRLILAVSGKSRELVVGRAMPAGFEVQSVASPLPLRFERDGRMRLQVRPGLWTIELEGRRVTAERSVTRPEPNGLWKDGDEAWVFEARPELRVVRVEGVQSVDPAQTTLPEEWRSLPAYAMPPGATMLLTEQRRGDAEPPPDRLTISRTFWLDFDGGGYSVHDVIGGELARAWRLDMAEGTKLGRVSIDHRDQFITTLDPGGRQGVEVRLGRVEMEADSRIEGRRAVIPATSFAQDFESVSASLQIPVGWRLLHAGGADRVTGTWIELWGLVDFFLLLLTALVVGRLYGWAWSALALVALGITLVEPGAPRITWLLVLISEALVRALDSGKLLALVRIFRAGVWLALAALLIPFAIREIRQGIHPAAAREGPFAGGGLLHRDADRREPLEAAVAPAAPEEPEEGESVQSSKVAGASGRLSKDGWSEVKPQKAQAMQNLDQYDASIVVQTGQGLPRWSWSTATLAFNGPVSQGQVLHIYLLPPWANALLAFARVGLLAILAWLLLRRPLRLGSGWVPRKPLVPGLALLAVLLVPALPRAADFPSSEMLGELRERLLAKPACAPRCASANDLTLEASPTDLRLRLLISTATRTAVPLPGDASSWSPASVRVDGKPAAALSRSADGRLWLALDRGVYAVELAGPLPSREVIQIPLPLRPRHAAASAHGFRVDGIHEDGATDESIVLSRAQGAKRASDGEAAPAALLVPPFLAVERTLVLGLQWEVQTRAIRKTAVGSPLVIDVPLLPGESVTTPGIRVESGRHAVSLSLAPGETEVAWRSTLPQTSELRLRSEPSAADLWAETWRVQVGPIWHAAYSGIPATHRTESTAVRIPEWRPWPGEEVRIAISKPQGVAGQTLTIDASDMTVWPGVRNTRVLLNLEIRSSRGTQHQIVLPGSAEVESVKLDGAIQPIQKDGGAVVLSVPPGRRAFAVSWRQPTGLSMLFRGPDVDLGVPSTNSQVRFQLEEAPRWILWTGGPRLGPAVHFWSVVVVLLLLGFALARTRLTPLRVHDWVLLGLGLLQLDLPFALILPVCLLALGWRARGTAQERAWLFDLGQVALAGLVIASLVVLVFVVEQGLLQHPDMRVMGNGSSSSLLAWYQDRVGPALPRPWFFSLPLIVYRIAMLAWALWLASAGIRWARWTWGCLTQHGFWHPLGKKAVVPASTQAP